ncbi:hypothetical protein [Hymenobacter sp. BT770]|uniref:hypothetical protein n=2 Tax=Hymenobacter sp. BT770 TaxID=2886942 RepID=UPI001D126DEA|nr:hypothetical protein [Hymenobacter sp. BT770]MCC3151790.1 hypothetical protein [Hymenobacter sp. BT770]
MQAAQVKHDSMRYLLGGVALLGVLNVAIPVLWSMETSVFRIVLMVLLLVVISALWWALYHFAGLAERVVAVASILLGAYWLWNLSMVLNMLVAVKIF